MVQGPIEIVCICVDPSQPGRVCVNAATKIVYFPQCSCLVCDEHLPDGATWAPFEQPVHE